MNRLNVSRLVPGAAALRLVAAVWVTTAMLCACSSAKTVKKADVSSQSADANLPHALLVMDSGVATVPAGTTRVAGFEHPQAMIVAGPAADLAKITKPWRVVYVTSSKAGNAKVANAAVLVHRVLAKKPKIRAFLQLKGALATDPELARTTLEEAGAAVQTVAGDVVTAELDPLKLGPILALTDVVSCKLAGRVHIR